MPRFCFRKNSALYQELQKSGAAAAPLSPSPEG